MIRSSCAETKGPAHLRANLFSNAPGHIGRGGAIRTHDHLHPIQVRYQTALRPEVRISIAWANRNSKRATQLDISYPNRVVEMHRTQRHSAAIRRPSAPQVRERRLVRLRPPNAADSHLRRQGIIY